MTTSKTIVLTLWAFVIKVIVLLFNMLSKLVTALLPRRKHLLISWLQPPSAVILEPKKIKSVTVSIVSPSICCSWFLNFWALLPPVSSHWKPHALCSFWYLDIWLIDILSLRLELGLHEDLRTHRPALLFLDEQSVPESLCHSPSALSSLMTSTGSLHFLPMNS